jgi:hypothetical protein
MTPSLPGIEKRVHPHGLRHIAPVELVETMKQRSWNP